MKAESYTALQRKFLLVFSLFLIQSSLLFSQQVAKTIPYSTAPEGLIGFLQFTPSDYGSQKHPLIIFLHGIGERGNGTSQINSVTANAIPKFCAAGASMRFTVNGQTSSFVVLSPQLSTYYGSWQTFYVKEMIKYAKANLQIDTNRIYITGLSLGGGGIWNTITEVSNGYYGFDGTIAAAAPVCGTQEETDANMCSTVVANHLPIWNFHSMDDGTVGVGASQHAEILLSWCSNVSPAPKFTYYQYGNHSGAWNNAYDTGHITTPVVVNGVVSNFTANPNLYEWFLSNSRSSTPTYTAPVASAGSAQTITLPTSSVTLSGSGTGTNGATISSYSWVKTSGPSSGSITTSNAASTGVTGLVQGTYVFTLTVTDNHGLTNSASVTITVNPAYTAPVASAGSAQTITLPTSTVTLSGSGTGTNGATISSYSWVKTSGPSSGSITTSNAASTGVTGLVQGTYVFTLTVTDNHGLTNSASVTITVNPAYTAPVASAGSAQTITLPTSTVTLSGSGTGTNGATISSYSWVKTSGPSSGSITTSNAASTGVTGLVQGTYVFTLTVTDNHGLTNSASVTITVNPAYTAPVADAGTAQAITLPISTVTLNGSGTGTNGATISSYSWAKTSGPAAGIISLPLVNSTLVTALAQGVYVFTLTVTDNHGLTNNSSVTVTVNPAANQSPVANAGNNISIALPTNSTTLDGSASSDPDGSIASYAWAKTSGPSSYAISNGSTATPTISNLVQGVYVFTLTVTDNAGATATSTVSVTVNPAPSPTNQSPVANAGNNISITLPTNSANLDGSASNDPDGTIASYAWAKTSGPSSYAINNGSTATPTINNLVQGTYTFTLTVTDNAGATASSTVTVTVNAAPNQSPVANAGNNISITLPTNSVNLDGTASNDPDGNIASYAWAKTSGPSSYAISNGSTATPTINNLVQGVYTFTLTVTDNAGATASSTVTVTVNAAANQSPVANAGNNISITLPTNSANLDGTASNDPDGNIASYAWAKTSGPSSYAISNGSTAAPTINNLVQGVYTFTLTVTDNAGATASSTVTVTVNAAPNQSPVANAGNNISITLPTNSVNLDGTASNDPDGNIASYAWAKTSGPSSYGINNGSTATPTINNLVQGVYTFTLTVTDNAGATASSTVTVTVNAAPNQSPVANAGNNISITLPTNSATLDGGASNDPDGTIASYAWVQSSGPSAGSISTANAVSTNVTGLVQGVYTFTLTVTDNAGATASSTVTVTVNKAPNKSPVANAGADIVITLPTSTADFDGSASYDPDGSIASYSWNKISGDGAITIVNSNTTTPSAIGLSVGTYVFELTVTDNEGATATDRVTVTVNPEPNKAPIADAGKDTSIALPSSSVVLSGSNSSDPDGTIAGYAWKQVSGPGTATITGGTSASVTISDLAEGDYVFELQVTDNGGATATARVKVSVINNFRYSQFFKLYPNPAVNTINFQYIDDKNGKLHINVYDASGKLTKNEEFSKEQSLITSEINISNLKPGMYYMEIRQADGRKLIRPFVKQ